MTSTVPLSGQSFLGGTASWMKDESRAHRSFGERPDPAGTPYAVVSTFAVYGRQRSRRDQEELNTCRYMSYVLQRWRSCLNHIRTQFSLKYQRRARKAEILEALYCDI